MAAAVVEGVDATVGMPRDDEALAGEPGGEEVARSRELAFVPEPEPHAPENAALLLGEHGGVGVHAAVDTPALHQPAEFLRHAVQSTIG